MNLYIVVINGSFIEFGNQEGVNLLYALHAKAQDSNVRQAFIQLFNPMSDYGNHVSEVSQN